MIILLTSGNIAYHSKHTNNISKCPVLCNTVTCDIALENSNKKHKHISLFPISNLSFKIQENLKMLRYANYYFKIVVKRLSYRDKLRKMHFIFYLRTKMLSCGEHVPNIGICQISF